MSTADPTRPDDGADAWETPRGLVTVTAPVGASPYYRLEWYPVEGQRKRQQSTGGRAFEKAWAKAVRKETELLAGATPKTQLPASVGIEYWLDPKRPTEKGGWGYSMNRNMGYYARTYFVPAFGHVRHMDLRRSHFQACVNKTPTRSEGANLRRAANNLIAALRQGDYLLETRPSTCRTCGDTTPRLTRPGRWSVLTARRMRNGPGSCRSGRVRPTSRSGGCGRRQSRLAAASGGVGSWWSSRRTPGLGGVNSSLSMTSRSTSTAAR